MAKEFPNHLQQVLQLIVVDPMPGVRDRPGLGISERLEPFIFLQVWCVGVPATDQQHWTGDQAPDIQGTLSARRVRRHGVHIAVKLPGVHAVLIEVGAMEGKVTGLLVAKTDVDLAHALGHFVQGFVAAPLLGGQIAHLCDPPLHLLVRGALLGLKPMEWWAQTLNRHNLGNVVVTDTAVLENNSTAD